MGVVVGVFSAKGGVGKSLVATNLASVFSAIHNISSALIDLNAGLGCADQLLDLEAERTWSDLLPVLDELTPQHLSLAITEHDTGLHLLACPENPEHHALLRPDSLEALLEVFRQEYSLVILDTPTGMGDLAETAFLQADIRLVLLTPDAPTLRATQRYTTALAGDDHPAGLVLNQYSRGAPITPQEIREFLDIPLLSVLPVDQTAVWANVSYGQPCALNRKRGLGRALRKLAQTTLKAARNSELWESNGG